MSIGLTDEQVALADAVRGFVARTAPPAATRADLDRSAAGAVPPYWDQVVGQGLTGLHLPEEFGGEGASLAELAVVLEETAGGLLPGPLLPTVLTSAILARWAGEATRKALLPGFAGGTIGATALATAGLRYDGSVVDGTTAPVLGAHGAEILLLGADGGDGGEVWFTVRADDPAVTVSPAGAIDLTRGVATVTCAGLAVGDGDRVPVDADLVRALAAVLFAAEAVGLARWCLTTGLEYVKVREQFGRPVGSFQAIKHKCARLFVRVETMTAAAWDAARAGGEGDGQLALAAAAAAVTCLPAATEIGLETITLLGGIGYTWEHDTHLYWRRAMTLENLLGPVDGWRRGLGGLVRTGARSFDVDLPEEDPAFAAAVAATLAEVAALPDDQAKRLRLAEEGLVSPHLPRPYGIAASPVQQVVIHREYQRSGVTRPALIIGDWVLPTLLAHGTDEQREAFVPPTLRGDIVWCQLFSEPGAGSDLASLSTRAVKVDGGWRLDGQKVWTSSANEAHYGVCLARTDPDVPKHKGISYFVVDLHAPGVEVRPLREANGNYLFNEVFLTGVFVPDDRLVGEVNDGWRLARTTLGNERVSMGAMHDPGIDLAAVAPADAQADLGQLTAQLYALGAMGLRTTLRALSGLRPGAEGSVLKVAAATTNADLAERMMRWYGPAAATADGPAGAAVARYLSVPPHLIGGGTLEIQYNVIAERILGLPRG